MKRIEGSLLKENSNTKLKEIRNRIAVPFFIALLGLAGVAIAANLQETYDPFSSPLTTVNAEWVDDPECGTPDMPIGKGFQVYVDDLPSNNKIEVIIPALNINIVEGSATITSTNKVTSTIESPMREVLSQFSSEVSVDNLSPKNYISSTQVVTNSTTLFVHEVEASKELTFTGSSTHTIDIKRGKLSRYTGETPVLVKEVEANSIIISGCSRKPHEVFLPHVEKH